MGRLPRSNCIAVPRVYARELLELVAQDCKLLSRLIVVLFSFVGVLLADYGIGAARRRFVVTIVSHHELRKVIADSVAMLRRIWWRAPAPAGQSR